MSRRMVEYLLSKGVSEVQIYDFVLFGFGVSTG